jgi:hypothetical protein
MFDFFVLFFFALMKMTFVVHSQYAPMPLKAAQFNALRTVYENLNCTNTRHCPRFKMSDPCPDIGFGKYARRLYCGNGDVLELHVDTDLGANAVLATEIGLLTELQTLYLINLNISGTIPTEIGRTKMVNMNLCCQRLAGTVPTELARLTNIVELDVGYNQLSSTIPSEIGLITTLFWPKFHGNLLVGTAPAFAAFVDQQVVGNCWLSQKENETNCFDRCLQPICCNSTRFCPFSVPTTDAVTTMEMIEPTRLTINAATTTMTIITTATTTMTTLVASNSERDLVLARDNDEWLIPVIATVVTLVVVLLAVIVIACVIRQKRGQVNRQAQSMPSAPSVVEGKSQYASLPSIRQSTATADGQFDNANVYAVIAKSTVTYDNGNINL